MNGAQSMIMAYHVGFEICGAFFCIICLLMSTGFKNFDKKGAVYLRIILACASLTGFCGAVALIFDGNDSETAFILVRISNYLVFALTYANVALGLLYFRSRILFGAFDAEDKKNIEYGMFYSTYFGIGLCVVGFVLLSVSQFTNTLYNFDGANSFQRLQPFFLQQIIPGVVIFAAFLFGARFLKFADRHERLSLIFTALLAVCFFVTSLLPGSFVEHRFMGANMAECAGILLFAGYIASSASRAFRREQLIATKDAAIKEQRIRIMQNQIRPHFIFNSILAIKQLCIEEPVKAAEELQHFAWFLRANLEAMTDEEPVPVEKEIECIKEYVALEQADPASRFTVKYDIGFLDFKVPLLSVEPMVENAIRHGIASRNSGGEVKISTLRDGDRGVIMVEDNGIGFGSETPQQAQHRSIGIKNSQDRLSLMCGGDLNIASTGNGTIVRISVPLKDRVLAERDKGDGEK